MRCDITAGFHIIDLEFARNGSRTILVQKCERQSDRGLVAEDCKWVWRGTHIERAARSEGVTLVAGFQTANPRASRSVAVRVAEDAGTPGGCVSFDWRAGTRGKRRTHRDLDLVAGAPGARLERWALQRDQVIPMRNGLTCDDGRMFHEHAHEGPVQLSLYDRRR